MSQRTIVALLACIFLMNSFINGSAFFHRQSQPPYIQLLIAGTISLSYLFYPILGWLSDVRFTRYKVIKLSFLLGTAVLAAVAILGVGIKVAFGYYYHKAEVALTVLSVPAAFILLACTGLFQANIYQFGLEQLLEAPSEQLSAFIHWSYWCLSLARAPLYLTAMAVLWYYNNCKLEEAVVRDSPSHIFISVIYTQFLICLAALQCVLGILGSCLIARMKKHFYVEKPGYNPLKIPYKVLNYAWRHKCPEHRSAFTYWEEDIPPRIDLGKSKYGGPFTTEEVEDTKTFLRILFILLSLAGFHLSNTDSSTTFSQLANTQCPSFWILMLTGDPMHLVTFIIIIGVPIHQLLMLRYCKIYLPNMLKRMGTGLFCCLLKGIADLIIQAVNSDSHPECIQSAESTLVSCYILKMQVIENKTCSSYNLFPHNDCALQNGPFLLLIIPNLLQGLASLLVFLTALEFICAQAPLRLKGILIGVWYALTSISVLTTTITQIYLKDEIAWEVFEEVKLFFIASSFLLFLYLSQRYSYRVREETINYHLLAEEKYEREFTLRDEYEQQRQDELKSLYQSVRLPVTFGATDDIASS